MAATTDLSSSHSKSTTGTPTVAKTFGSGRGAQPRAAPAAWTTWAAAHQGEWTRPASSAGDLARCAFDAASGRGRRDFPLAKRANDRLHEAVRAHPSARRFAGASHRRPEARRPKLERTVTRTGFQSAMVHGPTNGVFFDDKRFWPIFERAQALDVPLYIHPSSPVQRSPMPTTRITWTNSPNSHGGLGLHRGDRHARDPHDSIGRIRQVSAPQDHPRASWASRWPFSEWPSTWRSRAGPINPAPSATPSRALLDHDERQLLPPPRSSAASWRWRGPDPLPSVDYPFVPNPPGTKWMADLPLSLEGRTKSSPATRGALLKM